MPIQIETGTQTKDELLQIDNLVPIQDGTLPATSSHISSDSRESDFETIDLTSAALEAEDSIDGLLGLVSKVTLIIQTTINPKGYGVSPKIQRYGLPCESFCNVSSKYRC